MEPSETPGEPASPAQRWFTWLLVLAILGQLVWLGARYAGRSPAGTSTALGLGPEVAPAPEALQELQPETPGEEPAPEGQPGAVEPPPPPASDPGSVLFGESGEGRARVECLASALVALRQGPGLPPEQGRRLAQACEPWFQAVEAEGAARKALLAPLDEKQQERLLQVAAEPVEPMASEDALARLTAALKKKAGGRSRPPEPSALPPGLDEALSSESLLLGLLALEKGGPALSVAQAEEIAGALEAFGRSRQERAKAEQALVKLLTREQLLWLRARSSEEGSPGALPYLLEEWLRR